MTEAAAATPAPEPPPPGPEHLGAAHTEAVGRLADSIDGFTRALEAARDGDTDRDVLEWALHRIADVQGDVRDTSAAFESAVRKMTTLDLAVRISQMREAFSEQEEAPPLRVLPHRHRRTRRQPGPRDVPLWPVPSVGAAAMALRHAWQAHTAAALAGTAATTVAAATAAAVLVPASPLHAFARSPVSAPNASASVYAATPVTSSPSVIPIRKGRKAAVNGSGWVFTPLPPVTAGDSYPPAQDSSGSQDGPSSEAAGRPLLQVQDSLDLGTAGTALLTISAGDGTGWVSWQASSDTAGVDLSAAQGVLRAGEQDTVTVSVTADLQATAGPATVTVTTGDGQSFPVTITWVTIPPPPSPDPSSSPSLPGILS